MQVPHEAVLLRVFIGESHRLGQQAVVRSDRSAGAPGAPGRGDGAAGPAGLRAFEPAAHDEAAGLSSDLSYVVEIVDAPGKDRRVPARAGRDDDRKRRQRAGDAGARAGAAVRPASAVTGGRGCGMSRHMRTTVRLGRVTRTGQTRGAAARADADVADRPGSAALRWRSPSAVQPEEVRAAGFKTRPAA